MENNSSKDSTIVRAAMIKAVCSSMDFAHQLTGALLMYSKIVWDNDFKDAPLAVQVNHSMITITVGPIFRKFYQIGLKHGGEEEGNQVIRWMASHEIAHVILEHIERQTPLKQHKIPHMILNIAADLAVADVMPEPLSIAPLLMSHTTRPWVGKLATFEEYAMALWKLCNEESQANNSSKGRCNSKSAQEMLDDDIQRISDDVNETDYKGTWDMPNFQDGDNGTEQIKQIIVEASQEIKNRGIQPGAWEEIIEELTRPRPVNINRIARILSQVPHRPSWSKMHKRRPFQVPGMRKERFSRLIIAWDTSGSMNKSDLSLAAGQILELLKYSSTGLLVMFDSIIQDTKVLKISTKRSEITEFITRVQGRGGTDFMPVLELRRDKYARFPLVIITDGEAPLPPLDLCYDTIWLITYRKNVQNFIDKGYRAFYLEPGVKQ